jgi:hypothetical protein
VNIGKRLRLEELMSWETLAPLAKKFEIRGRFIGPDYMEVN